MAIFNSYVKLLEGIDQPIFTYLHHFKDRSPRCSPLIVFSHSPNRGALGILMRCHQRWLAVSMSCNRSGIHWRVLPWVFSDHDRYLGLDSKRVAWYMGQARLMKMWDISKNGRSMLVCHNHDPYIGDIWIHFED